MTDGDLAVAVSAVLARWRADTTPEQRVADLAAPAELSAMLGARVHEHLAQQGHDIAVVRRRLVDSTYLHLKSAFQAQGLPATPVGFTPVPQCEGATFGMAAALATHVLLGLETVSYGSENDGQLFVNLVAMEGEGVLVDKSFAAMRGHTDAVLFPSKGKDDALNPRMAPSPDVVTLVGLRNPDEVPTTLMPLSLLLPHLSPQALAELKKPQFSVAAQRTFRQGIKKILGADYTALDACVIWEHEGVLCIRFSHSQVGAMDELAQGAQHALAELTQACQRGRSSVLVSPGDVLIVNNRLALHGRGAVGGAVGGESRWLLRTYGLDTTGLPEHKRHLGERPRHVLYP